jgi:hypothetical protein
MVRERFLLVKGTSDLGNRIFVLLSAVLYARVTNRTLLVDWRDGVCAPSESNALPLLFSSPSPGPFERLAETDSIRPAIWRGHINEPVTRMLETHGPSLDSKAQRRLLSLDLSRSDYDEEVLVLWDYSAQWSLLRRHFHGPLQSLAEGSRDAILGAVLRHEVTLCPEIRDRVDEFKREHLHLPSVGVHVRYSDYRSSLLSILHKLNIVLAREAGLRIFLATDNVEIKRLFEKSYPDVVTTPHWYPASGLPLHIAASQHDPLEARSKR